MRNWIVGLGFSVAALAFAPNAQAAGSKVQQGLSISKIFGAKNIQLAPQTVAPTVNVKKPSYVHQTGTLLAVFNDSIVVERRIDPVTLRAWIRNGTVQRGANGLANVQGIVAVEDRILQRIYMDRNTMDPVEDIKSYVFQEVIMMVSKDAASGHMMLHRVKPPH